MADQFGYKLAKLIRINPVKGIPSIYGEKYVNFIEESNFEERIVKDDQSFKNRLEIIYLETTALKGINDLYKELKRSAI